MAEIHASGFSCPWNRADMRRYIEDTSILSYVALDPVTTHVSGFILTRHVVGEADILTIAVAPQVRRKGTGYGLCHASLRYLAQQGVQKVHLEVRADNSAAMALYDRLGFGEVRRRKKYYSDPGQKQRYDAICMTLDMATAFFQYEPASYLVDQF